MNQLRPIYTEKRECQDCYKCLRHCPVKAIKVEGGAATVIAERCVLCGRCVEACPSGAKRVRDDLPRVRQLLGGGARVIASVAPSWAAELPEVTAEQLVAALRRLGFWAVSETALGAEEVSAHVGQLLAAEPRTLLSTACPAAVLLLTRHHPEHARFLTSLLSPVLAHCRMLRAAFGPLPVVFIGPCIAKKAEADGAPDLLAAALTFEELRTWLARERIEPAAVSPGPEDRFVPDRAGEGGLYPVDGGMIAGVKRSCAVTDASFASLSGIKEIVEGLRGIERIDPPGGLFVELLACEGGCIGGPKSSRGEGILVKRMRVLSRARPPRGEVPRAPSIAIRQPPAVAPPPTPPAGEPELREALASVGKFAQQDQLDCGGCGYESCRQLAQALVERRAERSMCVTYMRKLALKKANALLHSVPAAVVIADRNLDVIECNEPFARMFAAGGAADRRAMEGRSLRTLVDFSRLFRSVLRTGEELTGRDFHHGGAVLHGSIFVVEPGAVVGGLFQDLARPVVQKEQVIEKARAVIQKQLATVQQIAYLLGENAAESELILESIIESYSRPDGGEGGEGGDGGDDPA